MNKKQKLENEINALTSQKVKIETQLKELENRLKSVKSRELGGINDFVEHGRILVQFNINSSSRDRLFRTLFIESSEFGQLSSHLKGTVTSYAYIDYEPVFHSCIEHICYNVLEEEWIENDLYLSLYLTKQEYDELIRLAVNLQLDKSTFDAFIDNLS